MQITLRNFGGEVDWSSILVKPAGSGSLSIESYVNALGGISNEWKTITIPLVDFGPGVDFTQIANIEFPYSANAGNFDLGFSEIKFIGGTSPFLWFGESKTNNKHNGNGGPGELVASLIPAVFPPVFVSKVEFYANTVKIGEDLYEPYTFKWQNVAVGDYAIIAKMILNDGSNYESVVSNISVIQNTPSGFIEVNLTQPVLNSEYPAPANVNLVAQVNGVPAPESDYLGVSNALTGFRKLKFGYNPTSIYTPGNNVKAGGNTHLEITLRDQNGGGTNWADIKIKPMSSGNLGILSYINAAGGIGSDWKTIIIPLSDFDPSIDFTQLAYMEFPYSADAGMFDIAIKSVKFTGGTSPFVWFGDGKTNNSHNGKGGPGELVASLVKATNTGDYISKVEFFSGNSKLGEDNSYPYEFKMNNLPEGNYSVKAVAYSLLGLTDESSIIAFHVSPPPVLPSPLAVSITSPLSNTMYYAPVDFNVTALVSNEVSAGPDYLKVVNNQTGFRKLKLGYGPTNVYGSPQNVIASGNDTLLIVLKDFAGGADFSSILIKPSGVGSLSLAPYMNSAKNMGNGWKAIRIPLASFNASIDFTQLAMFEFPYSASAGNFELGVSLMKFVGSSTPFVWFGEGKTNNIHDGFNGPGQLLATLVLGNVGLVQAAKIEFYDGSVKIGEDVSKPFTISYNNIQGGLHKFTARVFDSNGLENHSDTAMVLVQQSLPANALVLNVTFATAPTTFDIQKATFRYNKDFAYSMTLDDGLRDAYTCAFPLLNGGYVAGNNTTYPGLFYTDGCGNDVKFKGGSAWYSLGGSMNDIHVNSTNSINWPELQQMLNAGWNIFNHSLQHEAGAGTNYVFQIVENTKYIRNKVGITTRHFVVPSGDQGYVAPCFANGMVAVYGNNGGYSGYPNGLNVSNPLNYSNFKLFKRFLYDDYYNQSNITQHIDNAANLSVNGNHIWYNDFTHRVGFQTYGGSLIFSTYEYYMNYIANTYGKNGSDRVWMAPLQEVFEYLQVRDFSVISTSLTGTNLQVVIDRSNLPDSLLKYALSFVINSDASIVSVVANQPADITFRGNTATKLINLEWQNNTLKSGGLVEMPSDGILSKVAERANSMVVSPNPANEIIEISIPHVESGILEIINPATGVVLSLQVADELPVQRLNIASLTAGFYLVRYQSVSGNVKVAKFIKR
jgi:hypothetical protein